jgi:cell division protein FtsB
VNVRLLELTDMLECPQPLPHALQARCLTAVGAALRTPDAPQVDLRLVEREGPRDWLAPRTMLAAYGALLALLAATSAVAAWSGARLRAEVSVLEAQHAVQAARVEKLTSQITARGQDAALKARVASLSAERDAKARLLRQLSGESFGNTHGWSPYLEALGRHPVPGLWLRQIRIERGGQGLALSGTSLEAEGVPRLLQELSGEEPYDGKRFRTFRIDRSKARPGGVDFFLGTEAEDES